MRTDRWNDVLPQPRMQQSQQSQRHRLPSGGAWTYTPPRTQQPWLQPFLPAGARAQERTNTLLTYTQKQAPKRTVPTDRRKDTPPPRTQQPLRQRLPPPPPPSQPSQQAQQLPRSSPEPLWKRHKLSVSPEDRHGKAECVNDKTKAVLAVRDIDDELAELRRQQAELRQSTRRQQVELSQQAELWRRRKRVLQSAFDLVRSLSSSSVSGDDVDDHGDGRSLSSSSVSGDDVDDHGDGRGAREGDDGDDTKRESPTAVADGGARSTDGSARADGGNAEGGHDPSAAAAPRGSDRVECGRDVRCCCRSFSTGAALRALTCLEAHAPLPASLTHAHTRSSRTVLLRAPPPCRSSSATIRTHSCGSLSAQSQSSRRSDSRMANSKVAAKPRSGTLSWRSRCVALTPTTLFCSRKYPVSLIMTRPSRAF